MTVEAALAAAESGSRLDVAQALTLYRDAPTTTLGRMANDVRRRKHPDGVVTYIIDRRPRCSSAWALGLAGICLFSAAGQHGQTLIDVVSTYRSGGFGEAVDQLRQWSDRRVDEETREVVASVDDWSKAAVALLHTEVGLSKRTFGRTSGEFALLTGSVDQQETHYRWAHTIIADLIRSGSAARDPHLRRFAASWCVLASSAVAHEYAGRWSHAVDLARRIGTEPDVQLLLGASEEYWTGPEVIAPGYFGRALGPDGAPTIPVSTRFGNLDAASASRAESHLRAALNVQHTRAEAAMRLGRLHFIFGRHNEARRVLERAVTEADAAEHPFISYAARLLLARVLEESRQPALAVEILDQAILSDPTAVSGRVALGQLLLAGGRHDEAWTTVRSVFDPVAHPRADPWSVYFARQYWQHDARLRFMRSLVSSSAPERVRLDLQRTVDRGVSERSDARPDPGKGTAAAPVFRATTDAVRIEVMVTDSGRPVRGLTARDFILTDRGQRQVIDRVTRAESVAMVILVDASESVSGASHDAVRDAVDNMIRARLGSDTISLLTLSDKLNLLAVRSQDESALRAAAMSIRPQARSKTALWDALFVGASLVADAAGWPLIVPVSDGGDNASWFSRDEALRRLARVGIQVSPVEVPRARIDFDLALGVTALRPLAEATGGTLFAAGDPRFDKSFSEMMSTLRESYVLSYRPSEAVRRHAGWHDVKLQLRPGVRGAVRARTGYFAPN